MIPGGRRPPLNLRQQSRSNVVVAMTAACQKNFRTDGCAALVYLPKSEQFKQVRAREHEEGLSEAAAPNGEENHGGTRKKGDDFLWRLKINGRMRSQIENEAIS